MGFYVENGVKYHRDLSHGWCHTAEADTVSEALYQYFFFKYLNCENSPFCVCQLCQKCLSLNHLTTAAGEDKYSTETCTANRDSVFLLLKDLPEVVVCVWRVRVLWYSGFFQRHFNWLTRETKMSVGVRVIQGSP